MSDSDIDDGPGLVESLWRFRWMVVIITVLGAAAGLALTEATTEKYEATARVILKDPAERTDGDAASRFRDPERHLLNESQRMRSSEVMAAAARALDDGTSFTELRRNVDIRPSVDQDLISVTATAPTAAAAAARANSVVEGYEEVSEARNAAALAAIVEELDAVQERLADRIDELSAVIAVRPDDISARTEQQAAVERLIELETQEQRLDVNSTLYGSGVELFEQAEIPAGSTGAPPVRNAAAGALLGFVAAGALAWWRAGRVDAADFGEEAGETLGAPLLAKVPAPHRRFPSVFEPGGRPWLLHDHDVERVAGEAYHFLATSLELALNNGAPAAVVVTSAEKGDGKTVTTINTALAAASDGHRVIIIDGDGARVSNAARRQRTLTAIAGLEGAQGLSDFVEYNHPIEECLHHVDLGPYRVTVMPRGSRARERAGFYRLAAFKKAMAEVKERADLVLVDAPPALAVSDAAALASHVDAVLLVVNRRTKLAQLEALRSQVEFTGTPVVGYVFNRARRIRQSPFYRLAKWH